ncbi:MAG: ribonuclease III [Acholeplasmatales bacterium]|jgi:ribonuclease-3|nr:ribonuclease III [Acholeplasmatales bacterium]
MKDYKDLEEKLGVEFKDSTNIREALTHSSYGNEHNCPFNERLEFLGDAVLEVSMSKFLYSNYNLNEGEMTKKRAQAVREEALDIYASKIGLNEYLLLGKGEEATGGRERPAIIADAFEAVLGACFLEFGFDKTYEVFERIVVPYVSEVVGIKDYKTTLQEYAQSDKRSLSYEIIGQTGPAHNLLFEAVVKMDENIIMGHGFGRTKKDAEQAAAREALTKRATK